MKTLLASKQILLFDMSVDMWGPLVSPYELCGPRVG